MKTKTFKRLAAAVAAITMMCAVPMMSGVQNVYADYTITINQDTKDATQNITTHAYKAYQVFAGDLSGTKLSNIIWGSGVDTTKSIDSKTLLDAVKSIKLADDTTPFSGCTSAAKVAEVLSDKGNDSEIAKAFADVVSDYKSSTSTASGSINTGKYTISVSAAGYYLVEDSSNPANSSMTRAILKVTGDNTEITPKMDYPTLTKKFSDDTDVNTASIGDTISYKLSSTVPDMTGYNKYYFIINDTLGAGLSLNYDSVESTRNATGGKKFTVKVGNDTLTDITDISKSGNAYTDATDYTTNDKNYYVVQNGQSFKLVFVNFKQYAKDSVISIEYSAVLNDNASLTTTPDDPNINTAALTYSSNPNFNYYGDSGSTSDDTNTPQKENTPKPDEPKPAQSNDDPNTPQDEKEPEPTSDTPDQKVVTYTASLKITKIGDNDDNKLLSGAVFEICENDNNGGTDAPGSVIKANLTTDSDGVIVYEGLGAGTYWIKETTAPAGYNICDPIKLVISTSGLAYNGVTWQGDTTFTVVSDASSNASQYSGMINNNSGATLPSTGGIGTTIFYVSGGALILGAGIVLVTKKRMSLKDDK